MIPNERAHLKVAALSDPGMSGKNNEDRFGVSAYYADPQRKIPSLFAVLADGIGGHKAGEVAAEIVVDTISQQIAASDASQPLQVLEQAIVKAGQAVFQASAQSLERKGMGATCACAWVIDSRLYTGAVGDSRIYLIREHTIRQLTTDHTWIQEAIDHGVLQPEQARNHPNAHVIRRYLGSEKDVEPDFRLRLQPDDSDLRAEANQGARLQPGDILLLCSDGLTDLVNDDEIHAAFQGQEGEDALQQLVDLANQRGGHDNITVVSLTVPLYQPADRQKATPRLERRIVAGCISILLLLALAIVLYQGPSWWRARQGDLNPTADVLSTPGLLLTDSPVTAPSGGEAVPEGSVVTPTLGASQQQQPGRTPFATPGDTLTPWPTNTPYPSP